MGKIPHTNTRSSKQMEDKQPQRSILKSLKDNNTITFATPSLPASQLLDDNNTTSRISLGASRRVSFAPEVTLHKIEVMPEPEPEKLPRRKEVPAGEEEMEFTGPVGGLVEQQYSPVFDENLSMELTQLFSKYSGGSQKEMQLTQNVGEVQPHDEPMELTQVVGQAEPQAEPQEEVQAEVQEEVQAAAHVEHSELMDLTEIMHEDETMDLTKLSTIVDPEMVTSTQADKISQQAEIMSPIKWNSDVERRHSGGSVASGSTAHTESTTMGSHRSETNSSKRRRLNDNISLQEFLTAISVNFVTDLVANSTIDFPSGEQDPEKLSEAYYSVVPMLESIAFCCEEMTKNIGQTKRMFDDIEQEIVKENPAIIKDYVESSSQVKQVMAEELQIVRNYSRLQARQVWYDWRTQLLSGVHKILAANSESLGELSGELDKELHTMDKHSSELAQLLKRLREEYRGGGSTALRQQLQEALVNLESSKQRLELVQQEHTRLTKEYSSKQSLAEDLKTQINKSYTEEDVQSYTKQFELVQKVSGLRLVSMQGTKWELCAFGVDIVRDGSKIRTSTSAETSPIMVHYMGMAPGFSSIGDVLNYTRQVHKLEKQIELIKLYLPTTVCGDAIEMVDFNSTRAYKVLYRLKLSPELLAGHVTIHVRVVYGEKLSPQVVMAGLAEKVQGRVSLLRGVRMVFE